MSEQECLTLGQLQLAKRITEAENLCLRSKLVKLRRDKPDGWKKTFRLLYYELRRRSGLVPRLEHRIATVEGLVEAAEGKEHDV
jgi:hypothetical protein